MHTNIVAALCSVGLTCFDFLTAIVLKLKMEGIHDILAMRVGPVVSTTDGVFKPSVSLGYGVILDCVSLTIVSIEGPIGSIAYYKHIPKYGYYDAGWLTLFRT
jgi:Na+-transporting NADH:ubiquinone oxidoreductase subunit NqrD